MNYILIAIVLLVPTCSDVRNAKEISENVLKRELIIYCENAMVAPLIKLKDNFELNNNCIVTLNNDCAQNLSSLIRYRQKGDLYLPASSSGFQKLSDQYLNYIVDSVFIGYNNLVIMALKGNPTGFNGTLEDLADKKHALKIANPETCSLGYDTRRMLEGENLYNKVLLNVVSLSTDSRGLVKSLINNEAQLVVNWQSDLYNNEYGKEVEVFRVYGDNHAPSEIYAGILSTSDYPELAKEFLEYATSAEGISVFKSYGFNRRKSLIF
ncbi:molybdate transport system substrate-binding protein [Saccharicrinis carchari]|uniref:Molybdate transport system substrate-binding protein n=1 Tax=Saccharicrinis carchari TaxID=1168039 RepID=A0A521CQ93_SACCC|nr:molybdate ABC transporter substrate-binding protein [Saccharicrinis carchari]SMO60830.1 molybdate transport system substrate-binding protein [Saccharicrinis carchari]